MANVVWKRAGDPVVEVVVRRKSARETFVFCLNQGGPGDGVVEVPITSGKWEAEDILTGRDVSASRTDGEVWRLPMHLDAWGYRILRLARQ